MPRTDLWMLNVPFWNPTYEEFQEWWTGLLDGRAKPCRTICIANAHTLNIACEDGEYTQILASADTVINDGFGYRIASKARGVPVRYNFNGTDLIPRLFEELTRPVTVFLYGASEEANLRAASMMERTYPMIRVVGRADGYGCVEETIDRINACSPDLLLVALGQPKQELFMHDHRLQLNVGVQIGVGGLFDFMSGTKKRAPRFMRDAGFEWLFRLAQEPRRLFRRYVVGNPVFLVRCVAYLLREHALNARTIGASSTCPEAVDRPTASKGAL